MKRVETCLRCNSFLCDIICGCTYAVLLIKKKKIKKGSSGVYKEEISMDRVHEIATEAIASAEKLLEGKL